MVNACFLASRHRPVKAVKAVTHREQSNMSMQKLSTFFKAKAKAAFAAYTEQMAAMKTDQRPPRPVAAAVPTKKLNGGGMPRRSKEAAAPAAAGAEA